MTEQEALRCLAKAVGLTAKQLCNLCALVSEFGWKVDNLWTLLCDHGEPRSKENILSLLQCWIIFDELQDYEWYTCLEPLRAHWNRAGDIYFTIPPESIQWLQEMPASRAKRVILKRLRRPKKKH